MRSKNLIDALSTTATETLSVKQRQNKTNEVFKGDHHLNIMMEERSTQNKGSEAYKSTTKKIKKHVTYIRNQKLRLEPEQIYHDATRREIEELFRKMQADSSSFKSIKSIKCDPEKLKKYFSNHFNVENHDNTPNELLKTPEYIKELHNDENNINHAPPTIPEMKGELKSLKNGKASTDVPPEFLKCASGSDKLISELHCLLTDIWLT